MKGKRSRRRGIAVCAVVVVGSIGVVIGFGVPSRPETATGGAEPAPAMANAQGPRRSFASGDDEGEPIDASAEEILQGIAQNVPCHLLRSRISYVFPDYMMMASDDRHIAGSPVKGLRWDQAGWTNGNGPDGMQSLEWQTYRDGRGKLIIEPYFDEDAGGNPVASAWIVYTAFRDAKVLSYRNSRGQPVADSVGHPLTYGIVESDEQRSAYRTARNKEGFYFLPTWRTAGLQTPYVTSLYERDALIPTGPNGETQYAHMLTTEMYVQEVCTPIAVWTPERIQSEIVAVSSWAGCAQERYTDPGQMPRCLADHYLADERTLDYWNGLKRTAAIVPVLGTAVKVVECLDTGDAYCWGEAAVSGVTDIATVFVPVAKLASASKIARVSAVGSKLSGAAKPMMGLAVVGQTGLGLASASDGDIVGAVSRFAMAGAFVLQLRSVPSGGSRLSSFRRVRGKTRSITANCATPEVSAPSVACDVATCRACVLRKPMGRASGYRSLIADAAEWQTGAPYTTHPILVHRGDDLFRGVASRYVEIDDAVRWVAGSDDAVFFSHRAGALFRARNPGASLAARSEALEAVSAQVAAEVRDEIRAMTSSLGSEQSHKLYAWAQRQRQLTLHSDPSAVETAQGLAFTADRKLAAGYANSLDVPAARPRYMLHVKARDSGYIGERLGTTQQLEAYRVGFIPADDAVALYVQPREGAAWFKLQRHDDCAIEVFAASGEDLSQATSLGRISKHNVAADIAAVNAQHADVADVTAGIERALSQVSP